MSHDMGKQSKKHSTDFKDKMGSPGPGQYETDYKKIGSDSKKMVIGGKSKDIGPMNNLGPGSYKADYNVVKNKVVSYDMGKGS